MKHMIMSVMGFVVMGFLALAAQDYLSQAMYAGKTIGSFTVKDWADSFARRGAEAAQMAEREMRRDKPMREYLPDAPGGWTEVDWTAEYQAVLKGRPMPATEEHARVEAEIMQEVENHPVMVLNKVGNTVGAKAREVKMRKSTRVFVRDDDVMILQARFIDTRKNKGLFGDFAKETSRRFEDRPIVMAHRGLAFRDITPRRAPEGTTRLRAEIRGQLEILIRTNAARAALPPVIGNMDVATLRDLTDPNDPAAKPDLSQAEAVAQMRRDKIEAREREIAEQKRIEQQLQRKMHRARAEGLNEVCITYRDERHCRWVD